MTSLFAASGEPEANATDGKQNSDRSAMRGPKLASPSNILSVSKSITLPTTTTTAEAVIVLTMGGNGECRD
jgi:hypothetical protein